MTQRINYYAKRADVLKHLVDLSQFVHHSTLEEPLVELVFMRASQLNGCAYCMDMHSKDARANGETEQRLYVLPAWREASFYTERERAALAWCEAVTRLDPQHGVSDEILRRRAQGFQRGRTGRPGPGRGRHQRMEPSGHPVPQRTGHVPASQEESLIFPAMRQTSPGRQHPGLVFARILARNGHQPCGCVANRASTAGRTCATRGRR
ncbi:MAG TPA: carboxymuconolactone decarboxylase family protein [Rhodanobacteraceae bacterium]